MDDVAALAIDYLARGGLPRWRHLGCMIDESSKRMDAARFGHRTPGTVPGLPHPNPHGRHTEAHMEPKHGGSIPSAEREEAARDLIWRANSALVERLLSIMNEKDDPELSAIDNKRRRYANILEAMGVYFHKIGHDKLPELGTYIASLGVALEDLIRGVTDPLFVMKGPKRVGSKRDSMRTWGARLQAALGVECLILSGLSRKTAASEAASYYEALASLKRGTSRGLKGSLLSWYDRYDEGRVPVPELQQAFQTTRRAIKAAKLLQPEYQRVGKQFFAQAVKSAIR
jgi:hypothetical protein